MSLPKRLDLLLLERGLASTRTKAQSLIEGGKVSVEGRPARKPGEKFPTEARISLSEPEYAFVSRGGLKLEAALDAFAIEVAGARALDVGQSTGGFTHCLLLRGAREVVGIDVGSAQLHETLRSDPRVTAFENLDLRQASLERLGPPFGLFVADLSFISLTLVLPFLPRLLEARAQGVVLVKPQFELSQGLVGSGGIVRDAAAREEALARVCRAAEECGFTVAGKAPSPVSGGDGNQEFLLHLHFSKEGGI